MIRIEFQPQVPSDFNQPPNKIAGKDLSAVAQPAVWLMTVTAYVGVI